MDMNQKIIAIVGITEAIKQYGVPSQFCPSIAIIVGALFGYAEKPDSQGILEGIILGATVTGSYAVTKRVGQGALTPFRKKTEKPDYSKLEPDDDRRL
jgi:hypothetical protein